MAKANLFLFTVLVIAAHQSRFFAHPFALFFSFTLVVLLLAAVSGGAFYYFKIMKLKKDAAKGSSNLDDLDFDEDDEEELETEQEDEEV